MKTVLLGDAVQMNPTTSLKKGEAVKFVSMDKLNPYTRKVQGYEIKSFAGGMKFKNRDTLLARITPCLENGKTAQVDFLEVGEVGAGSTEYVVLRSIDEVTDPDFIYYLSISPVFRSYAIKSMIGTSGRQRIQNEMLANMKVVLPDLITQKKIAGLLGSIDEKIELNRRMNETLEQMGQALFRHYFITNPDAEKWKNGTISDLGEVITGKTPSKANASFFGTDVAFLKVPDMHGKNIVISTDDGLSFSGAASQSKKTISKWSTAVSCIASVGVVSLVGIDVQTNQQINAVVPKSEVYRFFNYYLMKEKSGYIKTLASSGSATPNLNKGQFEKITIVLPPHGLLSKFDDSVVGIFEAMLNNAQEIQTLTTLRDTLLPRLISGKIKV